MTWRPIDGLICAGGPVDGCTFALEGDTFGAPGLVLVGFGSSLSCAAMPARCAALINSAGFVTLDVRGWPANSDPLRTDHEPGGGRR